MEEVQAFLERVFRHLPPSPISKYSFAHWSFSGRPTDEGVGIMPVYGVNPDKVLARVMDVDHYAGNIDYVVEGRAIPDARFKPPGEVRFYQRISIPLLKDIQHESVLVLAGEKKGYKVACWYMLEAETAALDPKVAARNQYNIGAWLAAPGVVGYALSSAPRREDVNFLQWKALTAGADVTASKVIKANIEGMSGWAERA